MGRRRLLGRPRAQQRRQPHRPRRARYPSFLPPIPLFSPSPPERTTTYPPPTPPYPLPQALLSTGVVGLKAFLAPSGIDDFDQTAPSDLARAIPALKAAGGRALMVHAEMPPKKVPGFPRALKKRAIESLMKRPFSHCHRSVACRRAPPHIALSRPQTPHRRVRACPSSDGYPSARPSVRSPRRRGPPRPRHVAGVPPEEVGAGCDPRRRQARGQRRSDPHRPLVGRGQARGGGGGLSAAARGCGGGGGGGCSGIAAACVTFVRPDPSHPSAHSHPHQPADRRRSEAAGQAPDGGDLPPLPELRRRGDTYGGHPLQVRAAHSGRGESGKAVGRSHGEISHLVLPANPARLL